MFEFLLFVHILGVAAWFGANLVRAFAQGPMSKAGHATAASWHRATVSMGRVIHTPAAIAVFITGFGLVGLSEGAYEMTAPFVVVGIVVVVVGAVLAMSVLGPNGRRIASAYEDGDSALAESVARRSAVIGWVDTLLLAFASLVMVLRWGA
ncbi:MAG: DUF2269 family protein [bacterium]|nr:DUF2269 family protein [bacterium]MDE0289960.1 DUF2269 family protein [bacterium]MDE0437888.1 DUF2269 family protein [bacterium]